MVKLTNPRAYGSPCEDYYCFPKQMSTRGVSWSYLACAFKSDLNGKVDESKGRLLLMRGLLVFSEANEHPGWVLELPCMCIQVGFEGQSGRIQGHIASHAWNSTVFQRK